MQFGPIELTNTVSGVVLSVLLILVGGLAWTIVGIYRARSEFRVVGNKSDKAATKAEEAAENTRNVSNGFAGSVNRKLDTVLEQSAQHGDALDQVQRQLTEHLQWHLTEGKKND